MGKEKNPRAYDRSQKRSSKIKQSKGRAEQQSSRTAPSRCPSLQVRQQFIHPSTVERWQKETGQEQGQAVKYNRTRKQTILREVFYESLQWSVTLRVFRAHETGRDCCLLDGGNLGVSPTTSAQPGHVGAWKSHRGAWEFPFPAWEEVRVCFQRIKRAEVKKDSFSGGIFKSTEDTLS